MPDITVRLEDHIDPAAWEDLVARDPASTFFHESAWLGSLTASYSYFRGGHLVARDDTGRVVGGLPLVRSVRYGLTQLFSLPYGTYGGPLARPGEDAPRVRAALVRAWLALAARPGVVRSHLVLRGMGEALPDPLPAGVRCVEESVSLLRLPERFETLWDSFDSDLRRRSRKAEKLGVTVREISDGAGAAQLEGLYRDQARTWNHTPFPRGFFPRLVAQASGRARVWLAVHEGRPVSGQLTLTHRDEVLFWVICSHPEARRLESMRLLYVSILDDACRRGIRVANMGGSLGSASLETYKSEFGAEAVAYPTLLVERAWFRPLHHFQYRLRGLRPV